MQLYICVHVVVLCLSGWSLTSDVCFWRCVTASVRRCSSSRRRWCVWTSGTAQDTRRCIWLLETALWLAWSFCCHTEPHAASENTQGNRRHFTQQVIFIFLCFQLERAVNEKVQPVFDHEASLGWHQSDQSGFSLWKTESWKSCVISERHLCALSILNTVAV